MDERQAAALSPPFPFPLFPHLFSGSFLLAPLLSCASEGRGGVARPRQRSRAWARAAQPRRRTRAGRAAQAVAAEPSAVEGGPASAADARGWGGPAPPADTRQRARPGSG